MPDAYDLETVALAGQALGAGFQLTTVAGMGGLAGDGGLRGHAVVQALLDEQAALRRVATLVATRASPRACSRS